MAENKEPPKQAESPASDWQILRRAQLEWLQAAQTAQGNYQLKLAEASVEYHRAMHRLTQDAWARRMAMFEAAAPAIQEGGEGTASEQNATDVNAAVAQGMHASNRAAAEANTRAWFDFQDAMQAAYVRYVKAIESVFRSHGAGSEMRTRRAAFVGDEGPVTPEPFDPVAHFWGAIGRQPRF
jgi:hypothetical protein